MRTRDLGLVALGACLGAGLAWALLAPGGVPGPAPDAAEVGALRERVAALERELVARPSPLATAPRPGSGTATTARGGLAAPGTEVDVAPSGEASAPTGTRDAPGGARPGGAPPGAAPPPGTVSLQDLLGGNGRTFRLGDGGTLVPADEVAPTPALDPSDVRRLLDDGTDASLVRAAQEVARTRDRTFLADLVDRVNRPEHRAAAPRVIPTIAALKDRAWSALQATGAPDTPVDGDHGTAWASKGPDMGLVTLELTYDRAVRVDAVRVHETLAPGAVAKVEAMGPDGRWETLWEGTSPGRASPTWFEPPVVATAYATARLRLTLDTDRVPGWNELDAVELVGDGLRQWASGAVASSSYADP